MLREFSEQVSRRESLKIDRFEYKPIPVRLFNVGSSSVQIKEKYKEGSNECFLVVELSRRVMGSYFRTTR